jgi:hypothetical protein
MTFVAPAPAAPAEDLPHGAFWPAINPDEFRSAMHVDGTVTTPRLQYALINAIVTVNNELRAWRKRQEAKNIPTLADVLDDDGPERRHYLYQRAIYELAAADLMEHYLRYDATGDAQQRAGQQLETIDDHRRNAVWAIQDIQGLPRSTVELI